MTSIQSSQASAIYNLQATGGSQRASRPAGPPPGQQQNLGDVLASEGLSSEEQASLESDLNDALSQLFSSSEGRPDQTAIQATIADVFEKYGINAEEVASRLGAADGAQAGGAASGGARTGGPRGGGGPRAGGGPPPGGPPEDAASSESTDETDTDSTLQETLQELLDKLAASDDTETTSKLSELLVSGLYGVDEFA